MFSEPDKNNKKAMDDRHTHVSVTYIAWSMVFCFLSVLSKEQGITVIVRFSFHHFVSWSLLPLSLGRSLVKYQVEPLKSVRMKVDLYMIPKI